MWLLLVLTVLVIPVIVALADGVGSVRPRTRQRVAARPWLVPTATALLVTGAATAVMTGLAGPVTTASGDARIAMAVLTGANPAGRSLSGAEVNDALATLTSRTLHAWAPQAPPAHRPWEGVRPVRCQDHLNAELASRTRANTTADIDRQYAIPPDQIPPAGMTLNVSLTSFSDMADARRVFDLWQQDERLCDGFRMDLPASAGRPAQTLAATVAVASTSQPQNLLTEQVTLRSSRPQTLGATSTTTLVLIDHNVISVTTTYRHAVPHSATEGKILELATQRSQTAVEDLVTILADDRRR